MPQLRKQLKQLVKRTPILLKLSDKYFHLRQLWRNLTAHHVSTLTALPPELTKSDDLRNLIGRLMPQDCGKNLIRIGGSGDGGYLVPDDLDGIEYCFSPGVNTISKFEDELADRKIKSFLADYSVDSPPILRPEFVFDKKFLGASDYDPFFTLASWKNKYLEHYTGDLILQMDIEGGEYQVIINTPDDLLDQFRIVVIEFHSLHKLFDSFAFELISSCFEKLLRHFYVVHIHPNNYWRSSKIDGIEIPVLLEFTFLNKRRVSSVKPQREIPHKLDEHNVPGGRPLPLPECWYAGTHAAGRPFDVPEAPPR